MLQSDLSSLFLRYFKIMWVCVDGYMGWLSTSDNTTDIFSSEMKALLVKRLVVGGGQVYGSAMYNDHGTIGASGEESFGAGICYTTFLGPSSVSGTVRSALGLIRNLTKIKNRNNMTGQQHPHLFGLDNSNRDFRSKDSWGKNQFNSSFPASLCCFLHAMGESSNYLSMDNGEFQCGVLPIDQAFKVDPLGDDTYFAFESLHSPFQQYVVGALPRTDLVIQKRSTGECLAGIEVKLTALPDNTTCELGESDYGSEIVVRPDTIVYLACSLARGIGGNLCNFMSDEPEIEDWADAKLVLPYVPRIIETLKEISRHVEADQTPFLLQPIWKTNGKSPELANNCLDVFFWSDAGFTHFITEVADNNAEANKITRPTRTAIWLYKMLLDISNNGRFDHELIIDSLSFNTKNDKAFASSGSVTNEFMSCSRLATPMIKREQIKDIILGGGQNLLSPERRFDAIIYNSPDLFS